jgi:hypothetical protein
VLSNFKHISTKYLKNCSIKTALFWLLLFKLDEQNSESLSFFINFGKKRVFLEQVH